MSLPPRRPLIPESESDDSESTKETNQTQSQSGGCDRPMKLLRMLGSRDLSSEFDGQWGERSRL